MGLGDWGEGLLGYDDWVWGVACGLGIGWLSIGVRLRVDKHRNLE